MNEATMLLIEWCASRPRTTWSVRQLRGRPRRFRFRLEVPDRELSDLGPFVCQADAQFSDAEVDAARVGSGIMGVRLLAAAEEVIRQADEELARVEQANLGGCTPTRSEP